MIRLMTFCAIAALAVFTFSSAAVAQSGSRSFAPRFSAPNTSVYRAPVVRSTGSVTRSAPVYSQPTYSSGSVTRSAPVYSQPTYSSGSVTRSAPVYSTPTYSQGSVSRPVYSTPVYSTPTYSSPSFSSGSGIR